MIVVNFIKETKKELDKVIWSNRKELVSLSKIVIVLSIVVSIYLGLLDYFFNGIVQFMLKSMLVR